MARNNILGLFIFSLALSVQAQTESFFFSFIDKPNYQVELANPEWFLGEESIQRRMNQDIPLTYSDAPVHKEYVDSLVRLGIKVVLKSRWLNGVVAEVSSDSVSVIEGLGFVLSSENVRVKTGGGLEECIPVQKLDYGAAESQNKMLGIDAMHMAGVAGKGVKVAVFDGGFKGLGTVPGFDSLIINGRLKYTYDVFNKVENVFNGPQHGTNVVSTMGGYSPGNYIGGAYEAAYYLFKTENSAYERRIEEYFWLRAAEMADSLGVDIIHSSLGYFTFDEEESNYNYEDLDGQTAVISRAAEMASQKGMLVVSSAGNTVNEVFWDRLSFPADAPSVLTVGAVNSEGVLASFSAFGPTESGGIKPELVAQGNPAYVLNSNGAVSAKIGTSFSAPIVTALAAGIWSEFPELKAVELKDYLIKSADSYSTPSNETGYGVPNYLLAKLLITGKGNLMFAEGAVFPNPAPSNELHVAIDPEYYCLDHTVQVFDLSGRALLEAVYGTVDDETDISVSLPELGPGEYYIHVSNDQYSFGERVMLIGQQ